MPLNDKKNKKQTKSNTFTREKQKLLLNKYPDTEKNWYIER